MRENDRATAPATPAGSPAPAPRRGGKPVLAVLALLLIVLFAGLGTWQVYRLQWKLDLIARVDARVHADPVAPPTGADRDRLTAAADEYRRLRLSGTYLYEFTTPVQALTEQGSGYWLLTPMCTTDGQVIIVNRGFIPATPGQRTRYAPRRADGDPCAAGAISATTSAATSAARSAATSAVAATAAGAPATVVGLLRISEHAGAFTRDNVPAENRWYARDIPAIAAARGLPQAAPYFVDAAAAQNPPGSPDQPVGGLTVVSFHNSHLVYALTWYALALMVAAAWWWVGRPGRDGAGAAVDESRA